MLLFVQLLALNLLLLLPIITWYVSTAIMSTQNLGLCVLSVLIEPASDVNFLTESVSKCFTDELARAAFSMMIMSVDKYHTVVGLTVSAAVESTVCSLPFKFMRMGYECPTDDSSFSRLCLGKPVRYNGDNYAKCAMEYLMGRLKRDEHWLMFLLATQVEKLR